MKKHAMLILTVALAFPCFCFAAQDDSSIRIEEVAKEPFRIDLSKVRKEFCDVLESRRIKDGPYGVYRFTADGDPELYSSADVAIARTIMGEDLMKTLSDKERCEWIDYINSFAKEDGTYISGKAGHAFIHRNGMVIGALGPLGGKQKFPVQFYKDFDEVDEIDGWLERLNWVEQWSGSHHFWGGIHCFSQSSRCSDEWRKEVLEWLDKNLDPQTGWWRKGVSTSFANHLGGAAHIWPLYEHTKHPFPYPKRVIDSILEHQKPSGTWRHNFSYLDLDALYGLRYMQTLAPEYRKKDIDAAFEKSAILLSKKYSGFVKKKKTTTHVILSAIGIAGLLNQHDPERYYDTTSWTDIFSNPDLYQTDKIEILKSE